MDREYKRHPTQKPLWCEAYAQGAHKLAPGDPHIWYARHEDTVEPLSVPLTELTSGYCCWNCPPNQNFTRLEYLTLCQTEKTNETYGPPGYSLDISNS